MSEIIAQSHNSEAITSFHVTKNLKYILYTSLYCNQSAKKYGKLQLFNRDTGKTTLLRGQISIVEEKLDYSLSPINVLEVPVLVNAKGNKKVTKVSWVLMNTGDGIEAMLLDSFSQASSARKRWYLENGRDCITSFASKSNADSIVSILFCTKLGNVYNIIFDTITDKWTLLKEYDDLGNDSLTDISLGNSGFETSWESEIGQIENALISGFDNKVRFFTKQNRKSLSLETEPFYSTFRGDNILTSVDYKIVQRRSQTSFTTICCGNITNLGCAIYKRTTRGEWILLQYLNRISEKFETIRSVNCQIITKQRSDRITIFCGSEVGKIFEWTLDWKTNILVDRNCHVVGKDTDVVHKLQCINDSVYFLINSKFIGCIKY